MKVISNYTEPEIIFYKGILNYSGYGYKKETYYTFKSSNTLNSAQVLNYSFSRKINQISGQFSMQIKESNNATESDNLFDKIQLFDVVEFKENGKIVFVGLIKQLSIGSNASSMQKIIAIQGSSICDAFVMYKISTNMNNYVENPIYEDSNKHLFISELATKLGTKEANVIECFSIALNYFINLANSHGDLSSDWDEFIQVWFNIDKTKTVSFSATEIDGYDYTSIFYNKTPDLFTFDYPITVGIVSTNSESTFLDFIRSLLPQQVYELYEMYDGNNIKICCRTCPFDKDDWITLDSQSLDPIILKDYTLSRNGDNIYTAVISYVEGAVLSADRYMKMSGQTQQTYNKDKQRIYGYKPLIVNFIGYSTHNEDKNDVKTKDKDLKELMAQKNASVCDWYINADFMYQGTFKVVKVNDASINYPTLGNKLSFSGGEFYVIGESHSWSYGSHIEISYDCDRGGIYKLNEYDTGVTREVELEGMETETEKVVLTELEFTPLTKLSLPKTEYK